MVKPLFDKLVRLAALCNGEEAENRKFEAVEGTELNAQIDKRDGFDGEEDLASPDWRGRAGPRHKPTPKEREGHEATHVPFRDWCTHTA